LIPAFLIERFGPGIAKAIMIGLAILAAIIVLTIGYQVMKHNFQAPLKTEIKVGTAQAGAAQASGVDAVNTVGNTMTNDTAVDAVTRSNDNAIDHASKNTVAVDPAVAAAGVLALCARKSYRAAHPSCVQQPAP
jgi:hypothetical protein